MITSGRKIDKNEETGRMKEIEETPVVEIYIRCPSGTKLSQSQQEVKQATENTTKVSSSIELKDIEFVNTLSILSVSECETGESWTRGHHHGLKQRCNIQEQPAENNYKSLNMSTYKGSLLEQGNTGNEESSNWTTLPPPRPSLWKELYAKILEPKEKSHEKNSLRTSRGSLKKKRVRQLKTTYPLKKIQKSVRTNRASYLPQSKYIKEMLPVKEDEIKIYDLECVREDGNEAALVLILPVQDHLLRRPVTSPSRFRRTKTRRNRALGVIGTVIEGYKLHQNWWIQVKTMQLSLVDDLVSRKKTRDELLYLGETNWKQIIL